MDALIDLLDQVGSPDKSIREPAEERIKDAIANAPYDSIVIMFQVGCRTDIDERIARQSLLRAKLYLNEEMEPKDWQGSEALEAIKDCMLENICSVSRPCRRILDECLRLVHSAFSWDNFASSVFNMIGEIGVDGDGNALVAALGSLYVYTKQFKNDLIARKLDDRVPLSRQLITSLPDLLKSQNYEVLKLTFKILECVVDSLITQKNDVNSFVPWFDFMSTFPTEHFSLVPPEQYGEYVKCVKRIATISFWLMQQYTNDKKPPILSKFFAENYAGTYYAIWVQWIKVCANAENPYIHKKSAMIAMRNLKMCAFIPAIYESTVVATAGEVITEALFPYLALKEDDEAMFASDMDDFSRYILDETVSELNERQCASNTINALCSFNKKFHDGSIIYNVLGFINNGLEEEESPRTFGYLHLLGILRKKIKKIPDVWNNQLEDVIIEKVVPRTRSENSALRYKGTWLCGHYARCPMKSEDNYASFIKLVLDMAQDPDNNVRLGAINALSGYVVMKRAKPYVRTVLVPVVEEILVLMEKVNAPFLPTMLSFLAENFAPELSAIVAKLIHTLTQSFMAGAEDMRNMEVEDVHPNDEIAMTKFDAAGLAAHTCLHTINTLVLSAEHNKEAVPHFMPDVLRLFDYVLTQEDVEQHLDVVIEILQHALFISEGTISEEAWQIVPRIHKAITNGAVDFFAQFEPVLDNFIASGTEFFINNDDVIKVFYEMCAKIIVEGVADSVSDDDKCGAPQLCEAIFHYSKAHRDRFDAHAPEFVMMLLQGLQNPDMEHEKCRRWLICAMCDAFWYNAELTLNVIHNSGAYPFFFEGMFGFLRGITTAEERKGLKKKNKAAAKCPLSILNRRVIILGLTELLNAVCRNDQLVLEEKFVEEAIDLINYCIFENAQQYTKRIKSIEYHKKHHAHDDGSDEELEDVDLGDNQHDDGAGNMADFVDNNYDDIEDEDQVIESDDEDEDKYGDGGDEGDDYTSPIDEVNEAEFFVNWIQNAASGNLPHYIANQGKLDEGSLNDACQVTAMYMQLIEEDKEKEKADHARRVEEFNR